MHARTFAGFGDSPSMFQKLHKLLVALSHRLVCGDGKSADATWADKRSTSVVRVHAYSQIFLQISTNPRRTVAHCDGGDDGENARRAGTMIG